MAAAVVAPVSEQETFSTHEEPVWRDRADFVINAPLAEPGRFEQLWCHRLGEAEFELCCIPFFLYDVALGDVVRTAPAGGRTYVLSEVVRASGRYVFRLWFGDGSGSPSEVTARMVALGALVERSSRNLLAVDARDLVHAKEVAAVLQELEDAGALVYETGRSA